MVSPMEALLKVALPALVGLIAGAIGSLIAPWVNWGIEKRKLRLAHRRDFIAAVRHALEARPDNREFRESAHYSQLRPYLSARTREGIESDTIMIQNGGRGEGVNNLRTHVLDELHALERQWGLL